MKSYKVRDIMSTELITVEPKVSVEEVYKLLKEHKIRQVPVCVNRKIVGIITDRDLRGIIGHKSRSNSTIEKAKILGEPVEKHMTPGPVTVSSELRIEEAVQIINSRKYGSLPVCDSDNNLIGIVTITDISNLLLTLLKNCN